MNTQRLRDLQAAILGDAACAPFVITNDVPKVASDIAMASDREIAKIINAARLPRIVKREVGDGAIALALGIPAGPVFLLHLEALAAQPVSVETQEDQLARVAVARQAWRSLLKASFDVGDTAVRAGLDLFVGTLLDEGQANTIKALAEEADLVSAEEVSRALRGPWGDEQ